ncbi:MAG: helix-turn-helix domain-containing protein [Acidobacteriota bacterium]
MLAGHTHRILEAAAQESIERIRRDHSKAPQRLKPLLAYIEEHLFDPSLDVNQLKRNCGVRDNSVPIQFHSAVGRPPHGYIEDRRLETACKLLSDSNIKIWQISELLGYSSIQVFSRAFSRWSGQRPTAYRKKARQRKEMGETAPKLEESLIARTETLRKALAGELSLDEANQLIQRLRAMYPEPARPSSGASANAQAQAAPVASKAEAEQVDLWDTKTQLEVLLNDESLGPVESADAVWKAMQRHTWQEQSALVRDLRLTTSSLFHILRQRSRMVGREDPRRGVQVADLALKSLDVVDSSAVGEEELSRLKAQGWAWLASARCLANDHRGAEQAFVTAERFGPSVATQADIALFKASLRRDQRNFDEAWQLLDQASSLYKQAGAEDQLTTVLISRATVRFEEGDAAAAIPFLEEAQGQIDENTEGFLKLALYHNLVSAYSDTGRYSQALELLPQTRELSAKYGRGHHRIRLRWLEGTILRGRGQFDQAEAALLEARESFTRIEDTVSASMVCLDLAQLLHRQNRFEDLEQLSASMVPLFGALQQHREAYVSLQLFHRAVQERSLNNMVVEKAKRALQRTMTTSLSS